MSGERLDLLDRATDQLHHQSHLGFAKKRLDTPNDPDLAADHQPLANLKRLLPREMPRRDDLIAAPQLVPIEDEIHSPNTVPRSVGS